METQSSKSEDVKLPQIKSRQSTPNGTKIETQIVTNDDTLNHSQKADQERSKSASSNTKSSDGAKKKNANETAFKVDKNKEVKTPEKTALKVHEKTTAAYRYSSTRLKFSDIDVEDEQPVPPTYTADRIKTSITSRKENDNLNDFISKKREMFLLEYSLNVKRDEITKLNDTALQREETLRQSEKTLEEDAARFDAFLKDNNLKTMEATRRADGETKVKVEKVQEVKRLNNEIASIRNELAKYDEQLEDCRKYKEFLDALTPAEWLKDKKRIVDEEMPMYFTDPKQLLDIFKQLEENNTFLIQNSQETERVLEDIRQKKLETENEMESEVSHLKAQIDALQVAISKEEQNFTALDDRSKKHGTSDDQDLKLDELHSKVEEVYVKCIGSNEANISTLQMLTKIEKRMEELFHSIDSMPTEYVQQAEKTKEKERRQKQRAEKLEMQRIEQEKRLKRALERSQAPSVKKGGKPVMFRSQLPANKKETDKHDEEEKNNAEEEHEYFFT